MLFDETYFEESLIWSQDKIILIFGKKKKGEIGFGKSVKKLSER